MTSYIFLDTLRFFAHHGVGEQETVVGNEFTVSLRLQVDIRRAAETDDVADTVSYADVHTAVKAEMDIPSKLLEHVCGRIINRLFHDFPQIEEITLKLAKRASIFLALVGFSVVRIRWMRFSMEKARL